MKAFALVLSGLLLVAGSAARAADAYPSRVIKLIVMFPAGGPVDVMGRLIAQSLSASLGREVIVDNRVGAGGTLAGRIAANAEPDGYTLLLGSSGGLGVGPALYKNVGFDPVKSFVPVAMVSDVPYLMFARRNAPFDNVRELVAYAKANPGKLNFGVPNGASPHLLALAFKAVTRTDVVIVPYKGASNAITDVIGGQIDVGIETTSVLIGHLQDGNVKALGVVRDERLPGLPAVPTMIESGLPELRGSSWTGILAPLGTPRPIVELLRGAIIAGLKSPDMVAKFKTLDAEAKFPSEQEFGAFIADETRRSGEIIRAAGVKAE
jgi:tripartite-type tricarboxylate transporter receptor subunit TctC